MGDLDQDRADRLVGQLRAEGLIVDRDGFLSLP